MMGLKKRLQDGQKRWDWEKQEAADADEEAVGCGCGIIYSIDV